MSTTDEKNITLWIQVNRYSLRHLSYSLLKAKDSEISLDEYSKNSFDKKDFLVKISHIYLRGNFPRLISELNEIFTAIRKTIKNLYFEILLLNFVTRGTK